MRSTVLSWSVILAIIGGCLGGESTDQARWWFSCNNAAPPYPTGEVTPTLPPPGPHLDQETIRRDAPVLAEALDACVRDGDSELRGAEALRADRFLPTGGSGFWWGERHVGANRIA